MKKQILKSALIAMAGVGLTLGGFSIASALTIDPTIYDGYSETTLTAWGSIVISPDGYADAKTVNGYTALGVTSPGNDVDGEIDGNEAITFNFTNGLVVSDFTVAFLFANGYFSDTVNEISITTADTAGDLVTSNYLISLEAIYPDTYNLKGADPGASVTVISDPVGTGSGVFTINNPFGNAKILSMTFFAANSTAAGAADSDYAIGKITVVPEPGTILLFGTGLAGLAAVGRRRKSQA